MSKKNSELDARWARDLVHLAALAEHLETLEQGDLMRWVRAAVELMIRRAAFQQDLGGSNGDNRTLLGKAQQVIERHGLGEHYAAALAKGVEKITNGERVLLGEPPLPLVCRRCGGRFIPKD